MEYSSGGGWGSLGQMANEEQLKGTKGEFRRPRGHSSRLLKERGTSCWVPCH